MCVEVEVVTSKTLNSEKNCSFSCLVFKADFKAVF